MKQIESGYSGNHKSMFILPIGDIHLGNKYYNPKYLEKALEFAKKHKDRCRIVLMGDLLEVATKHSVGRSVYDENYPTNSQFSMAVELFKPYAKQIDCVIEGNHEERIIRDTSFEIIEELTHRLNVPHTYGKFSSIINVGVGEQKYSIFAWHGATGGTTEASVINAMLKMREVCISNIYLMGHTHKLMSFSRKIILPHFKTEEPKIIDQLFVNTGASLDYGGYGEQKLFPLSLPGYGVIKLYRDEKKMEFYRLEDI